MPRIDRTLVNPAREDSALRGGQRAVQLCGRHDLVPIRAVDALQQRALLGLARHDGPLAAFQKCRRPFRRIEPQARLALLPVRPVTGEAPVRQDRPHVAVEINARTQQRQGQQEEKKKSAHRHP